MRTSLVAVLLCLGGLAAATPPCAAQPAPKQPTRAFVYAFANTTVPIVLTAAVRPRGVVAWPLLVYGFVAGPAAGYLYADDPNRALRGAALRAGTAGAMTLGGAIIFAQDDRNTTAGVLGTGMVAIGGLTLIASAIADVDGAPEAAQRYNRRLGLSVAPYAGPGGSGLSVRFSW